MVKAISVLLFPFFASLANAAWPNAPFVTSGRDIHDSSGATITYAGANWPGAADVMIPEGLQYQSVATIVSKIKSLGMNVIRLTYATEMIDQIYSNGGVDIPISKAFTTALGATNGPKVFNQVLAKNPTFSSSITRLQVSRTPELKDRSADTHGLFAWTGLRRRSCRMCQAKHLCSSR